MRKLKLLFAACALTLGCMTVNAETDYTSLMSSDWTGSTGNFGGGKERYQGFNYDEGKIMYQSFTAPAAGIYEIKFYAVTSCTADRYSGSIFGDNIAQAYATAGNNKATVAMTVINQTGCTLVADANIRTLSVEAAKDETIEYGLENIAVGGNWYTIKELSAKMKTVAEIFQDQYDEACAIWENSTENEEGAKATFKTAVDALGTALTGTLAEAQAASDALATALVTYESKSYPVKGSGVKYDFTSKMNMAIDAWTCVQGNGPNQYGFTGATETYGNTAAGDVMYQTITGLANGEYEIHFYAVANAANGGGTASDDSAKKVYAYANDQTLDLAVIEQNGCTPSDYERTFTVMVTDGTLKYGITNNEAAGNWYICKNVALYMTGAPDLSDYYDAIAAKLTTANGLKSSPMKVTVLTALQTAIDTTEGYEDITVIGTLESLSNDLTTAIDNANTSIANYTEANSILTAASSLSSAGQTIYANNETVSAIQSAYDGRTLEAVTDEQKTACNAALSAVKAWLEIKDYADALVAVENTSAEANTTLTSAISEQNTAATGATTTDAVTAATTTLKTAMTTYAGAADPTSGNRFDLTFMLTNPDLTNFTSWNPAAGWYTDMEGGNSQVMHNDGAAGAHGDAFYEYWSETPASNGNFTLYQKVTLPEGTYSMTCDAFSTHQSQEGKVPEPANCAVYFYANETQGSLVSNYPMAEKEISFINESEQEVKIGLKALTGNTYRWMGIGYVKLYKEYTDNTTYAITTNISNADVAVTVDGESATSAKALKTVTLTVSNFTEGYAVGSVTATYNDGEVKNLDVANPSANVYTYQQPAYDVTVTINVIVDKSALNTAIADATAARKASNEGEGVFQIPAAAGTALATAIETAQGVYDNASATVANVADAVTAINAAKTTYEGATLNAPDADKRYVLTLDGKGALTFKSASTEGGYGMPFMTANVNLAQAFLFEATATANTYKLYFYDLDGNKRYICTRADYGEGGTGTYGIRTATDKSLNILIAATTTDGVFNMLNTACENNKLGSNDGDFYTDDKYSNWTIAEASQASIGINTSDAKWGTTILPFAAELPNGVKAYTCAAKKSGTELTLVEASSIAANTPYIIEGSWNEILNDWGTLGSLDAKTEGWLTGVYEATAAPVGSYVLQKNNNVVGFYLVADGAQPTVRANRCYLTVQETQQGGDGARAFFLLGGEATAIKAIETLTSGEAEIYNAAGARVPGLQKGMNIIRKADGQSYKVMVK